jgi:hypothetical protein
MHRLPSAAYLSRFRLASLLFLTTWLLIPVAIYMIGLAVVRNDPSIAIAGGGIALLILILTLLQWSVASRTRCPLCMTPALASKSCAKHRTARRLLGSYRLRVALSILTRGYFRCPYCGEPTAMEVRVRRNHRH